MSPENPFPPAASPDDDNLGAPIAELRDLPIEVSRAFTHRVKGRIERRVVAGELVGLAWTAPLMMLLEFLRIPFEAFGRGRRP